MKNLVSHDKGKTFKVIMKVLEQDLGYHVQSRVIEARHFLPQRRPRIVIVGFRDKSDFDFAALDLPEKDTKKLRDILHPQDGSEVIDARYTAPPLGTVLDKFTLTDNLWKYLQGYKEKHASQGNGFGFGLVGPDDIARTLSARYYKDGSEILIEQGHKNPRRLTPRECARLMGFPDDFKITVSDMRAYKAFGNSVAVPVFEAVLRQVFPFIASASVHSIAAAE